MSTLQVIYLQHSGFAGMTDQHLLIFDYYRDPSSRVPELLMQGKKTYVFSSHAHGDHFVPQIGAWQDSVASYILSDDIKASGGLSRVPSAKLVYTGPYQRFTCGELEIATYGSTDEGISFAVEVEGWKIFHAGDLNWWHWKGDTAENIAIAEQLFKSEMERLTGQSFHVAFFPVDSRLEECRTMGITEFCRHVSARQLVAMHTSGVVWEAPADFPQEGRAVPVWCPAKAGEELTVTQ